MEEGIEIKAASWQGIPEDEALQKTRDRQRREFTEDDTLSKTTTNKRQSQIEKKSQKKKFKLVLKPLFVMVQEHEQQMVDFLPQFGLFPCHHRYPVRKKG